MKKVIKKIIGKNNISNLRAYKEYIKSLSYSLKIKDRIKIIDESIDYTKIISLDNKNVFCGYFDIAPDNPYNENQILVHVLDKKAKPEKNSINICIANIESGDIDYITSSNAWCWQMGSRIRWSKKRNLIYYNDCDEKGYCCNLFNIEKHTILKRIPMALYDVSSDESFGISLNFDRLQRLRPGYGYSKFDDCSLNKKAPHDDGLFYVDIKTGEIKLLVSLLDLSNNILESKDGESYINHVSISPDGKKIMFFYIWTINVRPGWKATLWVIDLETGDKKCLEKCNQVSHYDWKNNDEILITGVDMAKKIGFYRIYNVETGHRKEIDNKYLHQDGHPVFSRKENIFYSDTYPNNRNRQIFFQYHLKKGYNKLLELYHDPRLYGEKRCDLHPHYFHSCEKIALDTTFYGNKRNVVIISMKEEINEKQK